MSWKRRAIRCQFWPARRGSSTSTGVAGPITSDCCADSTASAVIEGYCFLIHGLSRSRRRQRSEVLLQKELKEIFTQYQAQVIDWLPDDPEHVLVEMPGEKGSGVSRLNIYKGSTKTVDRVREGTRHYISDGRGTVRLRRYVSTEKVKWYFRLADSEKWQLLHESRMDDIDEEYYPPRLPRRSQCAACLQESRRSPRAHVRRSRATAGGSGRVRA